MKINEDDRTIIQRMFIGKDGIVMWTGVAMLYGIFMISIIIIGEVFFGGFRVEFLLWSQVIIPILLGVRAAQKGLIGLGDKLLTKQPKYLDSPKEQKDSPSDLKVTTIKPTTIIPPTYKDIVNDNIRGRWVILGNGEIIPLCSWQSLYGVTEDKVGTYFSLGEYKWKNNDWVLSEYIIRALDKLRETLGVPVYVNSLYRPNEDGGSAHNYGLAVDVRVNRIDTGKVDNQGKAITIIDTADGIKKAETLIVVVKELNINTRITWNYYFAKDLACVHLDVAPQYFSIGEAWENENIRQDRLVKFRQVGVNLW